jgi:hypothetical protein
MGKRIVYVAGSVLLAHVIASYICMWAISMRLSDLNERFGAVKYYLPTNLKVQAPVRVFSVLSMMGKVDSGKGLAAMWAAYVVPLVLLGGLMATAPRWLFTEDDGSRKMYGGKRR